MFSHALFALIILSVFDWAQYIEELDTSTKKTRIKSCGDDISIIKSAVDVEFQKQKTEFNLGTTSNLITLSSIKDEGKYSYAKTEEYIECL